MLGKFRGCGLTQFSRHATFQPHTGSLDVGSGRFPDFKRFGVIAKLKTDFLDNPVGLVFEFDDTFLTQKLVKRYLAFDVCRRDRLLPFARATAATASTCTRISALFSLAHGNP
jgi:hypothetical protein